MNVSISLIHRYCILAAAMFALAVALPASASAQNIEPTDEQYGNGLLDVAAGGGSSGDPSASSDGISELAFTGLDVLAIAAIGAGLIGAGFVVRRASRTPKDLV